MRVRVRLFGDMATLAGQSDVALELPEGADLRAALVAVDQAARRTVSSSVLFDEKTIHPSVAVLVNGSNVLLGAGLQTSLKDGDQVAVMPLISGG